MVKRTETGVTAWLTVLFWPLLLSSLQAQDIDTLQSRLMTEYVNGSSSGAEGYLSNQQADGSWTDIPYGDRSRTSWPPNTHVSRLRKMAVAFNTEGHAYYQNNAMLEGISNGLNYWYAGGFSSSNWWHNDIGQQLQLGPTLIMMEEHLSPQQIETGAAYLNEPRMTGQNRIWLAQQTVWRGCLTESLDDINQGMDAMKGQVVITTNEGIQPDFSFHQHGSQLYNGGYGRSFFNDVSYWMYMVRGLSFEFSSEKTDIFSGLVLDGTQWMVRRNYLDPACRGREISRPGNGNASGLLGALNRMANLQTERQAQFRAFADHIMGKKDAALAGNKHFWRSDFHAHHRPGFYVGVKMSSLRVESHEAGNNENLQGYYLSQGAMMIVRNGNEFKDIYPVWNWGRIPGTTTPHKDPAPKPRDWTQPGKADFAGGVSNGAYGVAGFDFNWDGAWGKKAWFFFDKEVMCLGAGIGGDAAEPIFTSINQSHLRDGVWARDDTGEGVEIDKGRRTLNAPNWVHHDSVGYVFPNGPDVELKNESQSGSWHEINRTYSSNEITEDVFSLWLDHGTAPADAVYEYIVVPGTDKDYLQDYTAHVPVRTISNTTGVQAVRHDGLGVTGMVFYEPGQAEIRTGLALRVDQPCIALLHEQGDSIQVSLSNPKNQELALIAVLLWTGGTDERKTFHLPGGGNAGMSVTHSYYNANQVPSSIPVPPQKLKLDVTLVCNRPMLSFFLIRAEPVNIYLITPEGKTAAKREYLNLSEGAQIILLDINNFDPGMYLVRLEAGEQQILKKMYIF